MTNLITPKQTSFINSLRTERVLDSTLTEMLAVARTAQEGSALITKLLAAPRVPRVAPAGNALYAERDALLASAEPAKYAVPASVARALDIRINGDLLFLEVKRYMGKRYINRLTGAPGAFSRSRFTASQSIGLLKFLAGRHVEFSKMFSDHYGVCGRCAAELTDQVSRATGFGPECRKVFGL